MHYGAWMMLSLMVVALGSAGCAKKESSFEKAGRNMDHALSDMDKEMDKTFNQ